MKHLLKWSRFTYVCARVGIVGKVKQAIDVYQYLISISPTILSGKAHQAHQPSIHSVTYSYKLHLDCFLPFGFTISICDSIFPPCVLPTGLDTPRGQNRWEGLFTILPSAQAQCRGQFRSLANICSMHKYVNSNCFFLSCLFQSAQSLTNNHSARQETTALVQPGVSTALGQEKVQNETKVCQKSPIERCGVPFTQNHYKIPRAVRKKQANKQKTQIQQQQKPKMNQPDRIIEK